MPQEARQRSERSRETGGISTVRKGPTTRTPAAPPHGREPPSARISLTTCTQQGDCPEQRNPARAYPSVTSPYPDPRRSRTTPQPVRIYRSDRRLPVRGAPQPVPAEAIRQGASSRAPSATNRETLSHRDPPPEGPAPPSSHGSGKPSERASEHVPAA